MKPTDTLSFADYLSPNLRAHLKSQEEEVLGISGLTQIGKQAGLESTEGLQFLCELYDQVKDHLAKVLFQRVIDRQFIDQRTRACHALNHTLHQNYLDPEYATLIGHEDGQGRIVVGPKNEFYCKTGYGKPVAPIPEWLQGSHVTLFGPPDDAKLSINAMNAYHRRLGEEPAIVAELLANSKAVAKWGADDEDSKTPLRRNLVESGENLAGCFSGSLTFKDPKSGKTYQLQNDHPSIPIKRFPGLALPCSFLFYRENPIPLHLYDFALHFFHHWNKPEACAFYVPKLENEEEAAYLHFVMETAEKLIQKQHPEYKLGTIRLFLVVENPRAIFRVNEMMDALYPYFAGASLGWHDYLASTARLFKEDSNYRIPVKADPGIVVQYIKASHDLLANVVGSRGGIKIGGMYGVLAIQNDFKSASFQVTMKGFFKDIITQLKRGLDGFWVAHPDFVRIGIALTEGWKLHQAKNSKPIETLIRAMLDSKAQQEMIDYLHAPDLIGLDSSNPLYPRSLLVADTQESKLISNNDPEEIRYNIFQTLQYLTDWLSGNGCVALPALIGGVPVRVMDDLATCERSRWEVWHEIHHGRFKVEEFMRIAHEELHFIRKDRSNDKKIVQVKWNERTERWYPIAMRLMLKLMTATKPVEFATELLMAFTVESVRNATDSWAEVMKLDSVKYSLDPYLERLNEYFSICGSLKFAVPMAKGVSLDLVKAEQIIKHFDLQDILDSASFHGDIGESKKTLDAVASKEQALVLKESESSKENLKNLGAQYLKQFGFKYLISAQGKTASEILANLEARLKNTREQELDNARAALWEISNKRLAVRANEDLRVKLEASLKKHKVTGSMIALHTPHGGLQTLCLGERVKGQAPVSENAWFELASLSKTIGSCFAVEYFKRANIPLHTSVNSLLAKTKSTFRIKSLDSAHPEWADQVTLSNLMKHNALNMHYVNGVSAEKKMPNVRELLDGSETYGYVPVGVLHQPSTVFQYSGGGFLVLEHLLESLENKPIQEITAPFFKELGLQNLSFEQATLPNVTYSNGYLDSGTLVEGTRKMFPAFAAGAMGTATDYLSFLEALSKAYHSTQGYGPISHDTAIQVLQSTDRLSQKFMGVNIGLGVFIAEAASNRLAIHQGANDGFRCLSVHTYKGPDKGNGFVILCNADSRGVLFVAEAAQLILKELNLSGVDVSKFKTDFDSKGVSQEELVNQGYKKLVFEAFTPDIPEEIIVKGPLDPLAPYNLAVGGTIIDVTNQRFARAENLLSSHLPIFDPELYGLQGKTMDSWESVRHNYIPASDPCDQLIFKMKKPSAIKFVQFSTQFHNGNHPQAVKLEGRENESKPWQTIIEKVNLDGHAIKRILPPENKTVFSEIRVSQFPDGGLSRLGLYSDSLPENEKGTFVPAENAQSAVFKDPISHSKKPLTPKYLVSPEIIQKNRKRVKSGSEVDVANLAYGGRIVSASNEHYGPAAQVISPYPPINMFDGSESARSRVKGHSEQVVVGFEKAEFIHRIEIDFAYFINNNPYELSIDGLIDGNWQTIVPKVNVKSYAGNVIEFKLGSPQKLSELKVTVYPDGGINRIRAYSRQP